MGLLKLIFWLWGSHDHPFAGEDQWWLIYFAKLSKPILKRFYDIANNWRMRLVTSMNMTVWMPLFGKALSHFVCAKPSIGKFTGDLGNLSFENSTRELFFITYRFRIRGRFLWIMSCLREVNSMVTIKTSFRFWENTIGQFRWIMETGRRNPFDGIISRQIVFYPRKRTISLWEWPQLFCGRRLTWDNEGLSVDSGTRA
jgi:hypothetical protein